MATAALTPYLELQRTSMMRKTGFTLATMLALAVMTSAARAQDDSRKLTDKPEPRGGFTIPNAWTRRGVVLERQRKDAGVSGDPCIVWDEAISLISAVEDVCKVGLEQ